MACLHPIKCIYHKPQNGEDTGHLVFKGESITKYPDVYEDDFVKVIFVPCGKCAGCALDYSNYWANRCLMESMTHKYTMFVTLTYNDACCPLSVSKRDVQKFLKRLRKRLEKDNIQIRYFVGSEYGGTTARPHYHIILFGLNLFAYGFHKVSNGLYKSDLLEKVWPFGFNTFAEANTATIKYCAKYSNKRSMRTKEDKLLMMSHGLYPEFSLKSTHPALGTAFYAELIANDTLLNNGGTFYLNGKEIFLPKLFLHKLKESLNDDKLFQDTIDNYILKSDCDTSNIVATHGSYLAVGAVREKKFNDIVNQSRKKI